jgi:hypothetical protein
MGANYFWLEGDFQHDTDLIIFDNQGYLAVNVI